MQSTRRIRRACKGACYVLPAMIATSWTVGAHAQAAAQQAGDQPIADIIVTAQRRAESVQNVPIAVSVLSNAALTASGATDSVALAGKVPSLSIPQNGAVQYFLRGVGTTGSSINSEQSVATYVDGVYIFSTWSAQVPLSSIERVEVLKGPQGTLFGRNTTGGVIQIVTRDPLADPTLQASVTYGNYDTTSASAYASTKLDDRLGVSLAVDFRNQGKGYGYNSVRKEDTMFRDDLSIQGKVVFEASENTKFTGFFWYDDGHTSGQNNQVMPGYRGLDGVLSNYGKYETKANTPDSLNYKSYLAYGRIDQKLGDFADLVSITSYRRVDTLYRLDQDATPATVINATLDIPFRNFSQELQLVSAADGPFTWLVGAYYFHSSAKYDPITIAGAAAGAAGVVRYYREQRTNSLAGFAQASYKITPDTTFTAGIRYTDETQKMPSGKTTLIGPDPNPTVLPFRPDTQDSSGWTWRLALDHHFTRDIMGYISYNRGLKSGGFPLVTAANLPGYSPEKLDAYEVGLKTQFLGGRVRINAAAYLYKFKDIQVTRITDGGNVVANAAAATMKGLDVDLDVKVSDRFNVYAAMGYLDGRYDDYKTAVFYIPRPTGGVTAVRDQDATGNRTIYSPKLSASGGMNYRIPTGSGDITLDGFVQFVDDQYVGPSNLFKLPAYATANASIGWTSANERFGIKLWARNITNSYYFVQVLESTPGIFRAPAPPRTWGVTLSTKM
ncbi:TonB-dependent receptor [Sphingobium sp. EM0848]|uniref:TonB-dependent receptor n=1 Tax=Sphingobium sp. EM0848 TaxID=2743473 RepID=UPI00159C4FD0|nr:TonB-dependent receptor [Sphingobium sp. EM0848]